MAPKKPAKSAKAKGKEPVRASASGSGPAARKTAEPASKVTKIAPVKKKKTTTAAKKAKKTTSSATPTATQSTKASKPSVGAKKDNNYWREHITVWTEETIFKDGEETELPYDHDQPLEDIIQEIGKRSLTILDKGLIDAINRLETGNDEMDYEEFIREANLLLPADYNKRRPFKCHSKLYRRCLITYEEIKDPESTVKRDAIAREDIHSLISVSIEEQMGPASLYTGFKSEETGAVSRRASKAASQTKPASPARSTTLSKAFSPTKELSPAKAASFAQTALPRSRPQSPSRASPASRKSPTRAIAPSRQVSPVSASAGIAKPTSRSSASSTSRTKSVNPPKGLSLTRPIRSGVDPEKPVSKAESERRFAAKNDYGELMRRLERHSYAIGKHGPTSRESIRAAVGQMDRKFLDGYDVTYALERGAERADQEATLRELGGQDEQDYEERLAEEVIDRVDHNGIVLNQRSASGGRGSQAKASTRFAKTPSPKKTNTPARATSSARGSATAVHRSPGKSPVRDVPELPLGEASKDGHGKIRSELNPQFLDGDAKKKKNPFFETMPQAETWHRNMPGFLPIGETPRMERFVSNQIEEDLGRTHEEIQEEPATQKKGSMSSLISDGLKYLGVVGSSQAKEPVSPSKKDPVDKAAEKIATMWDLPGLESDEEEEEEEEEEASAARARTPGRSSASHGVARGKRALRG